MEEDFFSEEEYKVLVKLYDEDAGFQVFLKVMNYLRDEQKAREAEIVLESQEQIARVNVLRGSISSFNRIIDELPALAREYIESLEEEQEQEERKNLLQT